MSAAQTRDEEVSQRASLVRITLESNAAPWLVCCWCHDRCWDVDSDDRKGRPDGAPCVLLAVQVAALAVPGRTA